MGEIIIADFGRNDANGKPGMGQKGFGFIHLFGEHKVLKGRPCLLAEQPGKVFLV